MNRDANWRDDGVRHRDTEHHTHRDRGHLERDRETARENQPARQRQIQFYKHLDQ